MSHSELATAPGHPFYKRLNELLDQAPVTQGTSGTGQVELSQGTKRGRERGRGPVVTKSVRAALGVVFMSRHPRKHWREKALTPGVRRRTGNSATPR